MAKGQGKGVVLGYLRYVLGFDSLAFEEGLTDAEKRLNAARKSIQKTADGFSDIGKNLSTYITLPVAGAAAAILKMGGDFESSMNKVSISTQGTAAEMKAMNDLALKLGKDTVFGATDAADAMDELAKNGLSAQQILEGAATAAVNLASAAGSELTPASKAISDVMAQFKIGAKDLPMAVDQITGAVNQSKLDFVDFTGAIAQAGGVAGSVGVDFKDFNAVIAGTSSLFASGSDAGTSFKTFLLALPGNSKPAIEAIKQYGLSFYDAQGNLRSMSEIAEELRTKLGGLNDQTKTDVMKTIFGTDTMRTAIGLMDQGAKGLDTIKEKIAETDAASQSAQRLKGFNGQMEQLKGAVETLSIAIAQSGFLEWATQLVTAIGNIVDRLSETNPKVLKFVSIVAGIAAILGPVAVAIGGFMSAIAPIAALIGTAATAAGGWAAVMTALVPPVAAVAAVLAAGWLAWENWDKVGPILSDVGSAIEEAIGPAMVSLFAAMKDAATALWESGFVSAIGAVLREIGHFAALVGSVIGAEAPGLFKAFASVVGGVFNVFAEGIRAWTALLSGDFSGAWEHAKGAVMAAVNAIKGMIGGLYDAAMAGISALVKGVDQWMGTKLDLVWDRAKKQIQSVADKFHWLWDVVVGHSYIPDMVDAIGANMSRLDALMVEPVKKGTKTTAEHFRDLAQKVGAALDDLYPKTARLREEMATLIALQNDKTLAPEVRSAALEKQAKVVLDAQDAAKAEVTPTLGTITPIPGMLDDAYSVLTKAGADAAKKMQAANDNMGKSFATMANTALNALSNLANSIKGGGLLDILSSAFNAFGSIAGSGVFGKGLKESFSNFTAISGFRANGGPVSAGSSYIVGERGPELFTAKRSGYVHANGSDVGSKRTNLHFDLRGAVMTESLLAQMNAMADGAALRGAVGGSAMAQSGATRSARRRIPGR